MNRVSAFLSLSFVGSLFVGVLFGDGPADNKSETVRPIPPIGMELSVEQISQLRQRCESVREKWARTLEEAEKKTHAGNRWAKEAHVKRADAIRDLEPEVLVFPRAVELAIEFRQFYKPVELDTATSLLELAEQRIKSIQKDPVWGQVIQLGNGSNQHLIVGGYQSKIDGSIQPYAVVVPAGYSAMDQRPRRLDLWFHGRGETLSEVNFLQKGMNNAGQYTPSDTFVLHPYGRYSNAFKFAGEVDVLEVMEYVQRRLPIDPSRMSVRGFSMGGAGCWQFATRHADRFFAANPGAGFSETPEFLKSFQGEDLSATPDYQRKLWQLYDNPEWCRNLIHCPTVAYSGEVDRQKQAADVMESAMRDQGMTLQHLIGPETAHKIHPNSAIEIERRMRSLEQQASSIAPNAIDFTTYTLRYNRMHWLRVTGLAEHWQPAHIRATVCKATVCKATAGKITGTQDSATDTVHIDSSNVTSLSLEFDSGQWKHSFPSSPKIMINGQAIQGSPVQSDRSWYAHLVLENKQWVLRESDPSVLRKRPGLQGPIDDAFLDSFLFVAPSGESADSALQTWTVTELEHAKTHWRKHFRGDVHSVTDQQLTPDQIASHNLVLFGDPESNSVISRLANQLPIKWTTDSISLGNRTHPRNGHAVIMIYPNPLNPNRYIVLNSGFTFREYDYLNNARQTPKLPDWAVVDIRKGSTNRDPGEVIEAGFFDESWLISDRLTTQRQP